jgi:SOS-response transcriptional repressor LexA
MRGLNKKQAKVLAFIRARMQRTGRSPSYREIAAHLGVLVRALKHQGILSTTRRHRGIHENNQRSTSGPQQA